MVPCATVKEIGVIGDNPVELSAGVAVIEATGGTTVGVGEALDEDESDDDDCSAELEPCESGTPAVDVTVVVADSEPLLQPASTASTVMIDSINAHGAVLLSAILRPPIDLPPYRLECPLPGKSADRDSPSPRQPIEVPASAKGNPGARWSRVNCERADLEMNTPGRRDGGVRQPPDRYRNSRRTTTMASNAPTAISEYLTFGSCNVAVRVRLPCSTTRLGFARVVSSSTAMASESRARSISDWMVSASRATAASLALVSGSDRSDTQTTITQAGSRASRGCLP